MLAAFDNVPEALRPAPIVNEPKPVKMSKTIWEKIGALLAGNQEPEVQLTENEQRLMASVELATTELESVKAELTAAQADLATTQGALLAAQNRITELEAQPAATHTSGRSDGDVETSADDKPWLNSPIFQAARKAAGKV